MLCISCSDTFSAMSSILRLTVLSDNETRLVGCTAFSPNITATICFAAGRIKILYDGVRFSRFGYELGDPIGCFHSLDVLTAQIFDYFLLTLIFPEFLLKKNQVAWSHTVHALSRGDATIYMASRLHLTMSQSTPHIPVAVQLLCLSKKNTQT